LGRDTRLAVEDDAGKAVAGTSAEAEYAEKKAADVKDLLLPALLNEEL